jgi:hypothetical protein
VKENFQEQSWNQMVDRVNDIDIFGPLTIDIGPGPRPLGPFVPDNDN